jgi:hypothetical protein
MKKTIGTKVNVKVWNNGFAVRSAVIIGFGIQSSGPHIGEPCYILRFMNGIEGDGYTDIDFV